MGQRMVFSKNDTDVLIEKFSPVDTFRKRKDSFNKMTNRGIKVLVVIAVASFVLPMLLIEDKMFRWTTAASILGFVAILGMIYFMWLLKKTTSFLKDYSSKKSEILEDEEVQEILQRYATEHLENLRRVITPEIALENLSKNIDYALLNVEDTEGLATIDYELQIK